jgi:hypothetical protein
LRICGDAVRVYAHPISHQSFLLIESGEVEAWGQAEFDLHR